MQPPPRSPHLALRVACALDKLARLQRKQDPYRAHKLPEELHRNLTPHIDALVFLHLCRYWAPVARVPARLQRAPSANYDAPKGKSRPRPRSKSPTESIEVQAYLVPNRERQPFVHHCPSRASVVRRRASRTCARKLVASSSRLHPSYIAAIRTASSTSTATSREHPGSCIVTPSS